MQIKNNLSLPISATTNNSKIDKNSKTFEEALKHFDDLYQQSQVSGVSTYLFTKALEDLGLHKGDDLKGIELLRQHHFNTKAPSIDAILKYGDVNQKSGNHNYMKDQKLTSKSPVTNENTSINQKPIITKKLDETPITQEIKKIDKKLKVDVSQAKNYYDVAKKLSTTIDPKDRYLNIDQILSMDKYTISTNSIQNQTPLTMLLKMDDKVEKQD